MKVRQNVAIVNPYSGGALLAPEFSAHGYDCVAVHSLGSMISEVYRASYHRENFVGEVAHTGTPPLRPRSLGVGTSARS